MDVDEDNSPDDELTISCTISREKLNELVEAKVTNLGWKTVGWAIENYKWDIHNRAEEIIYETIIFNLEVGQSDKEIYIDMCQSRP